MTAITYPVDILISNGASWARDLGLSNHQFSAYRVGDHAHIVNCSFDMATLMAVVHEGGGGYQARVEKTTRCEICQPTPAPNAPRFSYYHEGDTVYVYDWQLDKVVHEYPFGHESYVFAGALCRQMENATDDQHRERVMEAWRRVDFDARRAPIVA